MEVGQEKLGRDGLPSASLRRGFHRPDGMRGSHLREGLKLGEVRLKNYMFPLEDVGVTATTTKNNRRMTQRNLQSG